MKIENATPLQVLLVVLAIIVLSPPILSLTALCDFFIFSDKGQIGDTIGGITAPFINGLAAVLVFVAFKAQIEANKLLKDQDLTRTIFQQIQNIQDNSRTVHEALKYLDARAPQVAVNDSIQLTTQLNEIRFLINEVNLTVDMIDKYFGDKLFFQRKIKYLYETKFRNEIQKLFKSLDTSSRPNAKLNEINLIALNEIRAGFNDLNLRIEKVK